jgi:crossover junction endodeoxyribonuclease RuvC
MSHNKKHLFSKPIFLSLDLGTTFGYAVFSPTDLICHGFEKLTSKPGRYNRFESFICNLINKHAISEIYYEKVRNHIGVDAAHVYGGFEAVLQKICFSYNLECVGINVKSIKKVATGNGNASKQQVIDAINTTFNLNVTDNNEADALSIVIYVNSKTIE